jgi:hypothetical protein
VRGERERQSAGRVPPPRPSEETRGGQGPQALKDRLGQLLIVGIIGLIVLTGAAFAAAKVTESSKFCGQDCHEMAPYEHVTGLEARRGQLRRAPHPDRRG